MRNNISRAYSSFLVLVLGFAFLLNGCRPSERDVDDRQDSSQTNVCASVDGDHGSGGGSGGSGQSGNKETDSGTADEDGEVQEVAEDELSPEDQKLSDEIDEYSGDEGKTRLVALDARVRKAKSPDVRVSFLDAISFYGAATIGMVAGYLNDPDEEVVETAKNHFESAISEIEDESVKLDVLADVFQTSNDADFLDNLSTEINSADEKLAIETILRVLASGTPEGVKVALESYEFVTGEEYTDVAAAEAWLSENYTPPDEEEN